MIIIDESEQVKTINEMLVSVSNALPSSIENSIYYSKLKSALYGEIYDFCKEKVELKKDLNFLRLNVGLSLTEQEIREYLDELKDKYNHSIEDIGIEYHIETTRVDFGVAVFVIIKRNEVYVKKLVFRFKKEKFSGGIDNLSNSGIITEEDRKQVYNKMFGN